MYAKACAEVAEAAGLPFVNVYEAVVGAAGGDSPKALAPYL